MLGGDWFFRPCLLIITIPFCALDRSTTLCLCVPGFQRQVFKHVKTLSERSSKMKEHNQNKGSIFAAESAKISQKAQFSLAMIEPIIVYGFFVHNQLVGIKNKNNFSIYSCLKIVKKSY